MSIEAANKNYIIEALGHENNTTTTGGIIIQNTDETELAQIVSIGPDIEKNPIAVGSRVAVNWSSVVKLKIGRKECFVIHADHVLGVVADD